MTHVPRSAAATGPAPDLVEVRTFRLVKPYRPAVFGSASRELDTVIDRIARQLHGSVASRRTIVVADRKSRSYRIDYDTKVQEITFVLEGRREYQLLCRRGAEDPDDACRQLVETFALR